MDDDAVNESAANFINEVPELSALSDDRKSEIQSKLARLISDAWQEGYDAGEESAESEEKDSE